VLLPILYTELRKVYDATQQLRSAKALFSRVAPNFLGPSLVSTDSRNLSVVVIIGESTSKWNVSLYGYPRKTFAALEGLKNLLIFEDVVAPHTHTIPSLNAALTSTEFSPTNAERPPNLDYGARRARSARSPRAGSRISPDGGLFLRITSNLYKIGCSFWPSDGWERCTARTQDQEQARIIAASDLFDPAWYLNNNNDVHRRNIDPVEHYLRQGAREGRDPSPRFSTKAYVQRYPDVAASGLNPLFHYIKFGIREGRQIVPSSESTYLVRLETPVVPLIGVLNEAGIQTLWFSNQSEFGLWANPVSHHAKMAQHSYFHRKTLGMRRSQYFDGDMVSIALDRVKRLTPKTALFLHFNAAHGPYCDQVPVPTKWKDLLNSLPDTAVFGRFPKVNRADLNCYDAAVRYVAENIKHVIDWISLNNDPVILVYFSDHGEDVFSGKGHESSKFTHKMAQVPLLVHFNDQARNEYHDLYTTLENNRNSPVHLENMFDLILDLFGVELKDYSVAERSVASLSFRAKGRFILDRGVGGYVSFDRIPSAVARSLDLADPYVEQKRQLKSLPPSVQARLCAHRNNSLLKFMEAASIFNCLEMDIIISESLRSPMVQHDADDPTGLPLDVLLSLPSARSKRIWLDVKNLSDTNVVFLLESLKRFNRSAADTLVEVAASTAGSSAVARLSEAGYSVSYYLPTKLGIKCSAANATEECAKFAATVEKDLRSDFASISFDFKARALVKTLKIPSNVSMSTWNLDANLSSLGAMDDLINYDLFIVPYASDFNH